MCVHPYPILLSPMGCKVIHRDFHALALFEFAQGVCQQTKVKGIRGGQSYSRYWRQESASLGTGPEDECNNIGMTVRQQCHKMMQHHFRSKIFSFSGTYFNIGISKWINTDRPELVRQNTRAQIVWFFFIIYICVCKKHNTQTSAQEQLKLVDLNLGEHHAPL